MSERSKINPPKGNRLGQLLSRFLSVGITILIIGAIYGTIHLFNLHELIEALEQKTYDSRVSLQLGNNPKHAPSKDIIIVKFDDPTLKALEEDYGTWPWPRYVHANMIHFLQNAGAKAITYDIMFVGKDRAFAGTDRAASDAALVDAFRDSDNVYISMNFDNYKWVGDQLGKGLTMKDIEMIKPLSLNLDNQLPEKGNDLKLKNGFYDNDAMTFNSFRRILPEFLEEQDRIGFINHGRDKDAVSRSNPLFFRLSYYEPLKSSKKPFMQDKDTGKWRDAGGAPINQEGFLLDKKGQILTNPEPTYQYYPYLGFKLLVDLKLPKDAHPKITLTREGHLKFADYDIPLYRDGSLLIDWYNLNVDEIAMREALQKLIELRESINNDPKLSTDKKQEQLVQLDQFIAQYQKGLNRTFEAEPYKSVAAWEIIKVMKHQKEGKLTEQDKALIAMFKDKIVFIGTTAVSTYDIKTTPINKLLPGVILQATIFDNLYQNVNFMKRAGSDLNMLLCVLLCLIGSTTIFKMRSAVSGLLTTVALAVLYMVISVFLLKYMSLWVDVAMPMVALTITTIVTFMIKYMNRDQDYRKTYKLATTDGLTGLYNHRFFQEHLAKSIDYANRFNTKFSLILIDIDFFKKFNDTYGHQAGDEVLRQVARKLKNSVRSIDLAARYGGEEMAIILEKANETEALEVARKLVRLIADEEFEIMNGVFKHVTVSIGVATFPMHGGTPAELIEFSDKGLYRAKENGRNRVGAQYDSDVGAPDPDTTPANPTPDQRASA